MKNMPFKIAVTIVILHSFSYPFAKARAQSAMTNIESRNTTSLSGEWKVIIDAAGAGNWRQVWTEKKPQKKTDFVEYSFEAGPTLHVPGDFNTQMPELIYGRNCLV